MLTSYVVLVNRVGYEDGVNFGGGSMVVGPWGYPAVRAADLDAGITICDMDAGALRRQRMTFPLLRDERPDLTLRELRRLVESGEGRRL